MTWVEKILIAGTRVDSLWTSVSRIWKKSETLQTKGWRETHVLGKYSRVGRWREEERQSYRSREDADLHLPMTKYDNPKRAGIRRKEETSRILIGTRRRKRGEVRNRSQSEAQPKQGLEVGRRKENFHKTNAREERGPQSFIKFEVRETTVDARCYKCFFRRESWIRETVI